MGFLSTVLGLLLLGPLSLGCAGPATDPVAPMPMLQSAHSGRVYLLRGWRGVYSLGLDSIRDQLRSDGLQARIYSYEQWQTLSAEIRSEQRRGDPRPIVLVGHS